MAYLDSTNRPSAGSMAAVVAIHGGMAAALILGLSVTGVIEKREVIAGFEVTKPKPPPPPPVADIPEPTKSQAEPRERVLTIPIPPLPLPTNAPTLDTTTETFPPQPPIQPGRGEDLVKPIPSVTPSFAPVPAKPRNDPLRWVSTEDYRSNWIRQEMTGRARFRLEIAADGRVASCIITGSSGHPELDTATCALVSRRAKFQPARGEEGEAVAGSYSNVIDWQLPE